MPSLIDGFFIPQNATIHTMNPLQKTILLVVSIIILGIAYWLISPLFINKRVSEETPIMQPTTILEPSSSTAPTETSPSPITLTGTFTGFDKIHHGSGTARLLTINDKQYIRFEEDFEVGNGPDLFVHLGKDGKYAPEANLGKLKGNIGSQNYEIPSNIDTTQYSEVWVWCRAFSVPFAKAVLR